MGELGSWTRRSPPVQPDRGQPPEDTGDAEVPPSLSPTMPSTQLPFFTALVWTQSSDTCLDCQGKSHIQAGQRRQSLMEGPRWGPQA